jgi:hypothetical protein
VLRWMEPTGIATARNSAALDRTDWNWYSENCSAALDRSDWNWYSENCSAEPDRTDWNSLQHVARTVLFCTALYQGIHP